MAHVAPFDAAGARAPQGAQAIWSKTADGVRLRLARLGHGPKGTVFIFSGRTEYIEKYGEAASRLAEIGLSSLSLDWRGQGLSDRLLPDPLVGHVGRFADYQMDVASLIAWAEEIGAPKPWYLLAHSMGGAIGLRSVVSGLPVTRAVFSAPMWGIKLPMLARATAWGVSHLAHHSGLGRLMVPSSGRTPYPLEAPPDDNLLTHDPEMLAWMRAHLETQPGLGLGGPSLTWLREALRETRALRRITDPGIPCLSLLGSAEEIVDPAPIAQITPSWPQGKLAEFDSGAHELLMERPAL
ncbi:MAG: alpha/beta hydrolase, partial [Mangrovicoccus sp.]|nr:alpha/beta hydrolase [Mangrovicoccus sp.]